MSEHKILSLQDNCTGCFACMNICPKDAITLPEKFEGFYYPEINQDNCIDCGLCEKICPQITKQPTSTMMHAYYGWATDDTVRKASSSGGIFHILATDVINEGGIVYGASFNYEGIIRLECHSTHDVTLKALQKSKYVQNYVGFAFREIKRDLQAGVKVLFCGTPCQAAGLRSYLRKDYSNLIIADFICHGVPSMSLLRLHLDYIGLKNIENIDFRPKNREWIDDIDIQYISSNNTKKLKRTPWSLDEYFNMFENNISIRHSCKNCIYCNGERASDITLADFWGIYKYNPAEYDSKGISLVLSNTILGDSMIQRLLAIDDIRLSNIPIKEAEYVYKKIRTSADSTYQNSQRDSFLNDVYLIGYKQSLKKHNLNTKMSMRILRKIRFYLSSIKLFFGNNKSA